MFQKKTVRIPAEGGITLGAWLFTPDDTSKPLPGITMAHGYAGTRFHGLERVAESFAKAGFVVLLHDHRGFGDSEGFPRQDVNPWQQISDWRRCISYLQDVPEVDEQRIGLWGTSFAGGHSIILGATDRRLKAIVAQVPTIDGFEAGLRRVPPESVAALEESFDEDERAQLRGEAPRTQEIVSTQGNASYKTSEAVNFYMQPVPAGMWENKVTVRSTRWSRMHAPGLFVDKVSPTPLLMVVAKRDRIAVTDLALKAYEKALEPKALFMIEGGHFDPYLGEFEAANSAAVNWFVTHLKPKQS